MRILGGAGRHIFLQSSNSSRPFTSRLESRLVGYYAAQKINKPITICVEGIFFVDISADKVRLPLKWDNCDIWYIKQYLKISQERVNPSSLAQAHPSILSTSEKKNIVAKFRLFVSRLSSAFTSACVQRTSCLVNVHVDEDLNLATLAGWLLGYTFFRKKQQQFSFRRNSAALT